MLPKRAGDASTTTSSPWIDDTRPWSALEWVVLIAMTMPFAIGIVALLVGSDPHTRFVGDNAINELRLHDVGHYSVLVGPYSRDGWSHLGPAIYYLFALPYRILGSRSAGFAASALAFNGACVLGSVTIARRVGGRIVMLLTATALGILIVNLGWEFLRNPWNPFVTVAPFGLLFVSCWALACGRWWNLPLIAALATFCIQTHIAYLAAATPIVLWSLGSAALEYRRTRRDRPRPPRVVAPIVLTLGILAVMWAPPIIDQLDGVGNLNVARKYFQRQADSRGVGDAFRVVGEEFTLAPDWIVGREAPLPITEEPRSLLRTPAPILGLIWIAIGVTAWRRQRQDVRQLAMCALVATAAGFVAVASTTGTLFDYRLRMLWIVGAFCAVAALALAMRRWIRIPAARRGVAGVLVATVFITTSAASVAAATDRLPDFASVTRVQSIEADVRNHVPRGSGVLLLRWSSFTAADVAGTLALDLEVAGLPVRFDATKAAELTFGEHRLHRAERVNAILTIVVDQDVDDYAHRRGMHRIAAWFAEAPGVRRRDLAELGRLGTEAQTHGLSGATTSRIGQLLERTKALAVFASRPPPQAAPETSPTPSS